MPTESMEKIDAAITPGMTYPTNNCENNPKKARNKVIAFSFCLHNEKRNGASLRASGTRSVRIGAPSYKSGSLDKPDVLYLPVAHFIDCSSKEILSSNNARHELTINNKITLYDLSGDFGMKFRVGFKIPRIRVL